MEATIVPEKTNPNHTKNKSMQVKPEQRPEPTATWITITAPMAKDWLENNMPNNRNLNEYNHQNMQSDLKRGKFVQTGDTIKFDWNGNLIDGQHRLQAIVGSGQPLKLLVVRGLDPEVFYHIDIGKNRSASDALSIEGIEAPSKIAAMSKFIINYKRGKLISMATATSTKSSKSRITNQDVVEFTRQNLESMQDSYPYGYGKNNKDGVLAGSHMAGLHYIFKTVTPGADVSADDFFHKLGMGSDLSNDSPIYMLRARLIADLRAKRKMPPLEKLALVIKAWNLYRSSKKTKVLSWSNVQEAFPKPI